jgi:hypothetical protein
MHRTGGAAAISARFRCPIAAAFCNNADMNNIEITVLRSDVAGRLREVVDAPYVLSSDEELRPYECDGLSAYRVVPLVVVLPSTADEVQAVLRICARPA